MGARWYQPSSGTFLSRDTVFGELRTPFTLNRYTYGINNPVGYWDPDGHKVCRSMADKGCYRDPEYVKSVKKTQERQTNHFAKIEGIDSPTKSTTPAAVPSIGPISIAEVDAAIANLEITSFGGGSVPSPGQSGSIDSPEGLPQIDFGQAIALEAAAKAPGYYQDIYGNVVYVKGNGTVAWKNRIGGADGPRIGSTNRTLRTIVFGATVGEGAARARAARYGRIIPWAATILDGYGNYQENSIPGRSDAIVILDTSAETAAKAGGAWAAGKAGCALGTYMGGSFASVYGAPVGCFVVGGAAAIGGGMGADWMYDSWTNTSAKSPTITYDEMFDMIEEISPKTEPA